MQHLSQRSVAALRRFAQDGDWSRLPDGAELRILDRPLTGRHAVSVVRDADTLWVIIDAAREDALAQLHALITSWPLPAVLRMPFVTPVDVELVG